jgi:type II secretory pathway pseudopilin PulG
MPNQTQVQTTPTSGASTPPPAKSPNVTTVDGSSSKGKWLWLLLVLIVGAAAVGGTYYYMHQQEQKKTNQVEAQIAQLQSQLAQAQKKSKSTAASTFKVPELGIQFTTTSKISDLTYMFDNSTDSLKGYALFSTKNLITTEGAACSPGNTTVPGPIGSVTLSATPPPSNAGVDGTLGVYIKQIGEKYLYDKTPQSTCGTTPGASFPVQDLEDALKSATAL